MGQKIYKQTLMSDIQDKIKTCELYQEHSPDESAKARVEVLDKNPCNDGKYYAVMTLKGAVTETSTKIEDLVSAKEVVREVIIPDDFNKIFICGCVIFYNLKNDTINVVEYGKDQLSELFDVLIYNYFQKKTKILKFKPSKSSIFGAFIKHACLKEDYDAYKDTCETIVYGFGRFGDVSKFLLSEGYYNKEEKQLYKYSFPFDVVSYVNKTRLTSFEKNVNSEIDEKILNKVTNLSAKKEITNQTLAAETVYDFGNFIVERLNALERSDNALISEYSQNYQKINQAKAKYLAYEAFGGKNDWTSWDIASNNYLTFKNLSSNKTFYENALKNQTYMTNVKAQEQAAFLFNNNNDTIKYEYEGDSLKPFETSSITSSDAKSYIDTHMVDQKRFVVKPIEGSGNEWVIFNKEKTFQVIVPIKSDDKNVTDKNRTGETFAFLSNKDQMMEKRKFTVVSNNISEIERTSILFNGNSYTFTEGDIIDQSGFQYKNEMTKEEGSSIPAFSYFNEGLGLYFAVGDLLRKITEINLYFELIPFKVDIDIKSYCVESSQWKQTCEKALELEKAKRGKNVLRAVVDTVPYDPWEVTIKKLKSLYYAFGKLSANKDGFLLVPPNEEDLEKASQTKCKKCGQTKDKCTCEDVKLCDKIFPIDLFGVTGLLGLDSLLSKFGVFSAHGYIMDETDKKMTYAQVAEHLYNACMLGISFNTQNFSKESDESSVIMALTYDDLKNNSEYSIEESVSRQFSESDFKSFIKTYSDLIKKKDVKTITTEYVQKDLKVGISDGYAYIPIGKTVTFTYNLQTNEFKISGTSLIETVAIFALIETFEDDSYVEAAKTMINSPLLTGKENAQKVLTYPYKPDILALIGKSNEDSQKEVKEFSFAYTYIPSVESSKDLIKNMASGQEIPITFDIYIKRPIKCGFPKKEKPKCGSNDCNGKCGLEELFKTPIEVESVRFNPGKEMKKLEAQRLGTKIKEGTNELINNVKKMNSFACDIDGNLEALKNAKNNALDALYSFGKEMAPIMNLFPLKCLTNAANDGRNAICSASRQAQDKSVIEDFNQSVTHKLKTTEILASQALDATKEKFNKITSGLQNAVGPIASSTKNLWDNASIYNLCPERFGDYINDSGIAKSFGEGLEGLMKTDLLEVFKGILGSCMVDGILDSTLGGMNSINKNEIGNIKKILESGDADSIEALGKKYPELLEKFGTSSGGIDFNNIINSSAINTNFLQSFETELTKRLSPQSLMSSVKDKFTDPSTLINFAKTGVKTLITGGPGDMAKTLMDNAKGIGMDKLQGQIQGNMSSVFNSNNSKKTTNETIISSINDFIKEKNETYAQITSGTKIPGLE